MTLKELIQNVEKNPEQKASLFEAYLDDFIPNHLLKKGTLDAAFGLTADEMEVLYTEGFTLYQNRQYVRAREVFRNLVILNTFEKTYWFGLASTLKVLGEYENALKSYAIVTLLDENDPMPHFHAYECYRALNNTQDAKNALNEAKKRGFIDGSSTTAA